MRRPRSRILGQLILIVAGTLILVPPSNAQLRGPVSGGPNVRKFQLPPIPVNGQLIQDYASVLDEDQCAQIDRFQEQTFTNHNTPIVVVTIHSMAQYRGGHFSIEQFARQWFDNWKLGVIDDQGRQFNQAILVLVSIHDRKARIELGADWGFRWDGHCDKIMQSRMVPQFKKSNYSQGVLDGVAALAEMAERGPDGDPPRSLPSISWNSKPFPGSPVPLWGCIILFALGGCCFVAAYFFKDFRKPLIWAGVALFIIGFMLWIILIVLLVWAQFRFGGRSRFGSGFGGGFGGGGGFDGGGFSGGGGATGSW